MKINRQPSLRALKAFNAVTRHQQINKAAEELCVTPSAVSHLIKRLEQELGVSLVQRSGRNIVLTPAGEHLAPGLQRIFRSLNTLIEDIQEQTNPNVLNVSLRPYFAVKWLSSRLSRFWAKHPDIELRLIHTTKPVDFVSERVDLAIEWSKGNRSGIKYSLLIPGELTPVLSPALKGANSVKKAKDLLNYTLLRETDYNSWQDWFALAGDKIINSKHTFIDDSNVRYQAAIDAQGVELSCRTLISDDLARGKLISPFELSLNSFSYYLAEPENYQPNTATQKFIDWLKLETAHLR